MKKELEKLEVEFVRLGKQEEGAMEVIAICQRLESVSMNPLEKIAKDTLKQTLIEKESTEKRIEEIESELHCSNCNGSGESSDHNPGACTVCKGVF